MRELLIGQHWTGAIGERGAVGKGDDGGVAIMGRQIGTGKAAQSGERAWRSRVGVQEIFQDIRVGVRWLCSSFSKLTNGCPKLV